MTKSKDDPPSKYKDVFINSEIKDEKLLYELLTNSKIIPYDEQLELHRRYKSSGDTEALNALVACHIRLAFNIVDSFCCKKFSDDLRSEALLGIIEAINYWNPNKGRLSTVIMTIVRQRVMRYIVENSLPVRISFSSYRSLKSKHPDIYNSLENATYITRGQEDIKTNRPRNKNNTDIRAYDCYDSCIEKLSLIKNHFDKQLIEIYLGLAEKNPSIQQLSRMLGYPPRKLSYKIKKILRSLAG